MAHAGFQAEGGPGSPVDPNSDWYKWVHDPINQLLGLTHGVPEDGPGTYVEYDSDAALARERARHEHVPDEHRVEPHLPEFHSIR